MTSKELRDKRSKLMFDAHQIMSGENVTAEQRQSAAKMFADAQQFGADADMLEACEAETRSANTVQRSQVADVVETRSVEERRAATNKALRAYLSGQSFEKRDLTVSAEGALIPTGVFDPTIAKLSAGSVLDIVGRLVTATGNPINIPLINDTSNGFVLSANSSTTTDPAISSVTSAVDDYRSNVILVENSLIQDSEVDLVSFIQNAEQSRYVRTMSQAVTVGNGSHIAALTSVSTSKTTAANTAIAYGDLLSVMGTLDPAYVDGACWVMSNGTLTSQVLNIKDSNGRPIFLAFNDGGNSGFIGTIFGFPVKLNPYQPAFGVGTAAVVQFGNFKEGYKFRETSAGLKINVLKERYAELNKIGIVTFTRAGGVLTDAGTHPIVSLNIHA